MQLVRRLAEAQMSRGGLEGAEGVQRRQAGHEMPIVSPHAAGVWLNRLILPALVRLGTGAYLSQHSTSRRQYLKITARHQQEFRYLGGGHNAICA
jgi:hypothetical protein